MVKMAVKTDIEFVNMRLPQYKNAVKSLKNAGYSSTRMTKGTRKTILENYYKFLVNMKTAELGHPLTPKELEEVYKHAEGDIEYYEMYVRQRKVPMSEMVQENINLNLPEEFATEENVEKMQNDYAMIHNLSERMKRTIVSNTPRGMPESSFAQSLLLDPQYNLKNWYNFRRSQGMKNSSDDSMDGGAKKKRVSKTRRSKKSRKTTRRNKKD